MNIGNIGIRILSPPDETNASLFIGLPAGLERSAGQWATRTIRASSRRSSVGSLTLKPPKYRILSDLAVLQMMLALSALFELCCSRLKEDIMNWMYLMACLINTVLDGLEKDLSASPLGDTKGRGTRIIRIM